MVEVITGNLAIWTAAIEQKSASGRGKKNTQTAYGIKKLRELILELAVRGKLVPQDPNDEPASVLLEKIAEEKALLIKEGKIKKQKALPEIGEEEKTFELPKGWEWAFIPQAITNDKYAIKRGPFGSAIKKDYFVATGYKVYEQQHAINDDFSLGKYYIDEDKFNELKAFEVKPNDLIISCSGTVGKIATVPIQMEPGIINQALLKLSLNENILTNNFFKILFPAFYMKTDTLSDLQGTAQKNMVSVDTLKKEPFPLPPLPEQHRIVAKVDELMALCDQLEQQQTDSLSAHQTLVATLLKTLTDSENAEQLAQNWAMLSQHFDTLFTTEHSIDLLKQTILQLAVMGKLVPQDPNEEPASVLLEKIAEEKARLIKEGKIKKLKALPEISEDEKQFHLPSSWQWVRLGELLPEFQNGASSRGDKEGKEIIVLRLADIKNWRISLSNNRRLIISDSSIHKYSLKKDDVLIIRVNGSSGIVGRFVLCESNFDAIYCDHFIRMRFSTKIVEPSYLELLGSSALIRKRINDLFISTAGQKTINQKHVGSLIISLPPLIEQHRIVTKVDELMTLCDQLKAQINSAQTTQVHLADAIVEQAIA